MKKLMSIFCLLLIILNGCCWYGYYYQEGKTINECRKDWEECVTRSNRFIGNYIGLDILAGVEERCMEKKGYKPYCSKDLPAGLVKINPNGLYGEVHGIAGRR